MIKQQLHRTWCKTCNDWSFHLVTENENICETCNTVFTEIKLSEIPDEKIKEQRKRFKNNKHANAFGVYEKYSQMFNEYKPYDANYTESDAGQKAIDKEEDDFYKKRLEEIKTEREWAKQYKNLGRNEKCLCDSGKKYKHCCYTRVNNSK